MGMSAGSTGRGGMVHACMVACAAVHACARCGVHMRVHVGGRVGARMRMSIVEGVAQACA